MQGDSVQGDVAMGVDEWLASIGFLYPPDASGSPHAFDEATRNAPLAGEGLAAAAAMGTTPGTLGLSALEGAAVLGDSDEGDVAPGVEEILAATGFFDSDTSGMPHSGEATRNAPLAGDKLAAAAAMGATPGAVPGTSPSHLSLVRVCGDEKILPWLLQARPYLTARIQLGLDGMHCAPTDAVLKGGDGGANIIRGVPLDAVFL